MPSTPFAPKPLQVAAAVIGNALEWYDFIVFGFFAVIIARLFFPTESQYASLPGGKGEIYVFDVGPDNKLSNQKLFTDCVVDGVKCGPDGMRCDVNGNVWCSSNAGRSVGYSGVTVWSPEGKLIGRIRLPEICGNVCFGGPKRNRLFMAASQSLYAVYTATQGASPG